MKRYRLSPKYIGTEPAVVWVNKFAHALSPSLEKLTRCALGSNHWFSKFSPVTITHEVVYSEQDVLAKNNGWIKFYCGKTTVKLLGIDVPVNSFFVVRSLVEEFDD